MSRVLVVGAGGREHAIIRALLRSPQRPEVLATPGNAGILADVERFDAPSEVDGLAQAAAAAAIDLVVVGPEVPLVAGLVDACAARGVTCFGPSAAAAQLEGSKAYSKEVMQAAGVATAKSSVVRSVAEGMAAIDRYPAVLKADGLAAGKGVVIVQDADAAKATLREMLVDRKFGNVPVVVEEFLEGRELSLLAICDGERALALAPARDYKPIGDGDTGPNTGGMGTYSPVPEITQEFVDEVIATVHEPVLRVMAARGAPFHGVLYAGLMLTDAGVKVLEFNCRFGDPETQVVLPRLESDLLDVFVRSVTPGGLADVALEWSSDAAVCVVLASAGYPASSSSGDVIQGLDRLPDAVTVLHAGTSVDATGAIVTAGGRVLNVVGRGADVPSARSAAYAGADMITFHGRQLRRDIAK